MPAVLAGIAGCDGQVGEGGACTTAVVPGVAAQVIDGPTGAMVAGGATVS